MVTALGEDTLPIEIAPKKKFKGGAGVRLTLLPKGHLDASRGVTASLK